MNIKFISMTVILLSLLTMYSCDVKGTADQRYNLGIRYAIEGKFGKAEEEFQKALRLDKSYQPAKESLEVIEDAIDKKVKDKAVIYFFKAVANSNDRKFDEVISLLSQAISLDAAFSSAYYERGLAHAYKGDYDAAIIDFSKTITLNPKDAAAFNNRGLAYARGKQQYDDAFSDFNKAIEINPVFAEAYDNRGIAYRIKNDDRQHACADWKKACELNKCNSYNLAQKNGYCE